MDRRTIQNVWAPMVVGPFILWRIFETGPGPHDRNRSIGLALTLLALGGIILARYTLGRAFSVRAKAVQLVTTGIYSRIRNPIYVFGMIFVAGMILMIRVPVLVVFAVLLIPIQIVRARNEARVLEAKFGDEYREYRKRTWF